jgi:YesN/AraC family two-component response regulator
MDLTKKKVLVCDDNPVIVFMLESLISKKGIEVITAVDGKDGYDKTLTTHFDFIITDIEMPNMSGWDLIESVQKDGFDMKKVIVISAQLEQYIIPYAERFGVLKYYLKPIMPHDIDEIAALINAYN